MLRGFLEKIRKKKDDGGGFQISSDADSLNFYLPQDLFESCKNGVGDEWVLNQFIALQMMAEEGVADLLPNGFSIESEDAVRIDDDLRYLLETPAPWPGQFELNVSGQTTQRSFTIHLSLIASLGEQINNYRLQGPILILSKKETYLPTLDQWIVLNSIAEHQGLSDDERTEYENLTAIHAVQRGAIMGAPIDLSHFSNLSTVVPDRICVAIKADGEGNINLSPSFGAEIDQDEVGNRLGQIGTSDEVQSIRVNEQIVILDEDKLKATQEIIRNQHISADQVKQFFETPSAFLDTSLVDLDVGYSLRVKGATVFKHGYFGDTDRNTTDWFEALSSTNSLGFLPAKRIGEIIKNVDEMREFQTVMEDALSSGADTMIYKNTEISLENAAAMQDILRVVEQGLLKPKPVESEGEEENFNPDPVVVDIEENDEDLEYGDIIQAEVKKRFYEGPIDWTAYQRQPYKHQEEGIRWLVGLTQEEIIDKDSPRGCLLADDMGLGKTYMSLVGIAEYYQLADKPRPSLVVAPLSVINSWKDEVAKTYKESPFSDIVILQANANLPKYRITGTGVETRQKENAEILEDGGPVDSTAVKYSLKVGDEFGLERLDQPNRLVLTTYQTLRDYQFSLCRIDWAFVVFDEAQNIKNPNALQTRAAKGLRAQFKLLMTGTPVENHLGDFWCLFDSARAGLFGAYQDFRKEYMSPISIAKGQDIQRQRLQIGRKLRHKAGGLMLRRLKEDHLDGLPDKDVLVGAEQLDDRFRYDPNLASEMVGIQRQRYEGVINTTIEAKGQSGGGAAVLSGLFQLRDVSLHPGLIDGGNLPMPKSTEHAMEIIRQSAKLVGLVDILKQIQNKGEKALVFLINKRLQGFLKVALQRIFSIPVEIINGDTKAVAKKSNTPTRTTYIQEFENRPGFGVLIMSPVAAGVGLTITGANHVIHLERHWNPAKEAQATDRVYRIGQERNVLVYIPVLHHPEFDSFDLNLDRLLSRKLDLKDAVVTPEEVSSEGFVGTGIFGTSFTIEEKKVTEDDIALMPWSHFEALTAEIAKRVFGGNVLLTPKSNDKGADVVVFGQEQNILIQCKHTRDERINSEIPLREVHGAKPFYERASQKKFDKLILMSNAGSFGTQVHSASQLLGVDLMDKKNIVHYLSEYGITEQDILRRNAQPRYVL